MPCDYSKYPKNWKWLTIQIRRDRSDRCELCYAPNGALIHRPHGAQYPWYNIETSRATDIDGGVTKIVLTVHHLDFDPQNSNLDNLILLCQKCHLRLDKHHHRKKNAEKVKEVVANMNAEM